MSSISSSAPAVAEKVREYASRLHEEDPDEHNSICEGRTDPTNPHYHHSAGRAVRNELRFWDEHSACHKDMNALGFRHPGDMSGAFMELLRAHIVGEDPELAEMRQRYYEHWALDYGQDPLAKFCNGKLSDRQQSAWRGILNADGWQKAVDFTSFGTPEI